MKIVGGIGTVLLKVLIVIGLVIIVIHNICSKDEPAQPIDQHNHYTE